MSVIIMIFVLIATVFAIASGLWVAHALITAISSKRPLPEAQNNTDDQNNHHDT